MKTLLSTWLCACVTFFVFAVCPGLGLAQEPGDSWRRPPQEWDIRLGIPLWAAGLKGTLSFDDRQAEVDKSFTDIADILDFTAALNLEVRKSHWLFFANGLYLKTSQDAKPTRSIAGLVENVDLRLKQYLINSGLGYQVVDTKKFSLELFGGARIYVLDPEITLSLPAATPSRSRTKAWADPIVGLFAEYRLSRPVALFTEADVGGFGLNSDLTWQVNGGVQWDFARHWYLRGSYRFLSTDFSNDRFRFDVDQGGPQLEIGYHF